MLFFCGDKEEKKMIYSTFLNLDIACKDVVANNDHLLIPLITAYALKKDS